MKATVGVDLSFVTVTANGREVSLELWDTGGQERFQAFTPSYYRGAYGAILVYDVSDRRTFIRVGSWLNQIKMFATDENIVIILVGNKIDLAVREVSREEGLTFAKKHNILFIETSALENQYVSHMLEKLANKILSTHHIPQRDTSKTVKPGISAEQEKQKTGGCCS
ncbi:ras-related protein Rab-18-like isoform X2 [Ischnura elegans]|nr:ras-related protein Rab-18-like isoform X2 [Ischnura elegans]XP_046397107.1 ras-related protein Rab-18-like isoform X2 [Ischnura elegans]